MEESLYVIMNSEGKYFRRKGYGGYGDTWVDGLKTARIYASLGPARGVVSFFANQYPSYPPPRIVRLVITGTEVIDETERLEKVKSRKETRKRRWEAASARRAVEEAERYYQRAVERLEELRENRTHVPNPE